MEKDEKRIEDLINKLMSADTIDQAPNDFTDKVMSKIEALPKSKAIIYKPLIPKYMLWILGLGLVATVVYLFINQPTTRTALAEKINLPDLSLNFLEGWSFEFSNTLMYAVVLFAIMLSIQIPLLKQYFNNRLTI